MVLVERECEQRDLERDNNPDGIGAHPNSSQKEYSIPGSKNKNAGTVRFGLSRVSRQNIQIQRI